jgi:predicted HTH domain antitoxin
MNINFEIPQDIEQQIRTNGADLNREAKEAYLVELYRQRKISQAQLSQVLDLDRYETDGLLKKHGIEYDLTLAEFRKEVASLREAKPPQ